MKKHFNDIALVLTTTASAFAIACGTPPDIVASLAVVPGLLIGAAQMDKKWPISITENKVGNRIGCDSILGAYAGIAGGIMLFGEASPSTAGLIGIAGAGVFKSIDYIFPVFEDDDKQKNAHQKPTP